MARPHRQMQRRGQPVEPRPSHPGQIAPGERDSVDSRVGKVRRQVAALGLIRQETQIKADVMPDDGPPADECVQLRQHDLGGGRAARHSLADASEARDELRDAPPRIDQAAELRADLMPAHDHCRDLDDAMPPRREARRLHINRDELDIQQ